MRPSDFIDNKYTRRYSAIISARLAKPLSTDIYTETHHIIPESFYIDRTREGPAGWLAGNPDDPANLVKLTGREHALCHWLLTKMTEGVGLIKMQQAFDMMASHNLGQGRTMTRIITRAYERNMIAVAAIRSARMTESNPMHKPGASEKMRALKTGKKRDQFSAEWLANLTATRQGERNGMFGKTHSEETIAIISKKASLRRYSDATNDKRRDSSSGRKEITDGITYKKVKTDELQSYIDQGWIVKGKPRKKKA